MNPNEGPVRGKRKLRKFVDNDRQQLIFFRSRSYDRSRSRSRSSSYSRSRSSRSRSYSYSSRSRSRSPSIPRRRGSPSFLDRRRITRWVSKGETMASPFSCNLRHHLLIVFSDVKATLLILQCSQASYSVSSPHSQSIKWWWKQLRQQLRKIQESIQKFDAKLKKQIIQSLILVF